MTQLIYTETELMQSIQYCAPQIEAGQRLHGGFDDLGRYVPPRTLFREPAFAAWTQQLRGILAHPDGERILNEFRALEETV